jgi:hypothetical protein
MGEGIRGSPSGAESRRRFSALFLSCGSGNHHAAAGVSAAGGVRPGWLGRLRAMTARKAGAPPFFSEECQPGRRLEPGTWRRDSGTQGKQCQCERNKVLHQIQRWIRLSTNDRPTPARSEE